MGDGPLTDAELAEARALCAAVDFEPEPARPVDAPFAPHHEDAACWYYVTDTTGLKLIACRDEEVAQFVAGARSLLPAALDEIDRLTKERDERARLVKRLREIASVAARHLESNRNSRRDNHEAGAAVRRELARYFGETQSNEVPRG